QHTNIMHCLSQTIFFHAEDGIRDRNVTGVQTCALPILLEHREQVQRALAEHPKATAIIAYNDDVALRTLSALQSLGVTVPEEVRSEERRVGRECRTRRARSHGKGERGKQSNRTSDMEVR